MEAYTTLSLPVALHGAEKYSVRQLAVIYCNITPYRVLTESKCSGVTVQEFSDRRYTGLDYPAVAALTKQTLGMSTPQPQEYSRKENLLHSSHADKISLILPGSQREAQAKWTLIATTAARTRQLRGKS